MTLGDMFFIAIFLSVVLFIYVRLERIIGPVSATVAHI